MPHASATYIYILYTKCVMQAARDTNKWQPKNKNSWKHNNTYFICCFKTTIFILVKRYVSLCSFFYKSPFIFLLCSYEKLKFDIFKYFFHVLKKPWVIANIFLLLFNRTATNFWFEYLLIFLLLLHKMAIDFHGKLRHFFIKEIHNAWTIRRIPKHDSRIPNFTMWSC